MQNDILNIKKTLENNINLLEKSINEAERRCLEVNREIKAIRSKIVETPEIKQYIPAPSDNDQRKPEGNVSECKYCPNCGNYVGADRFCTKCGTRVRE